MNLSKGTVVLLAALAISPAALLAQGPPPPGFAAPGPGYGFQSWQGPPSGYPGAEYPGAEYQGAEYQGVGRMGFHDGIEGARRDFENHRRPDVNNRDEYRHPNVPGYDRREYRDAFRRGYQAGVEHIMNGYQRPY